MPDRIQISNVRLVTAPASEVATGLVGWISCDVNGSLRLDGLSLRQTAHGNLTLSFPSRRDARGRDHPLIRPLGDRTRREIVSQVLRALGFRESATP